MAEPFLAQIVLFGGNFAPRGWAFCHGQLEAIAQNTALFSLLGTTFGGDGRTTFGLPDFRSRTPRGAGNGPGLDTIRLGQKGGAINHTLTTAQIPSHQHGLAFNAVEATANQNEPAGHSLAETAAAIYSNGAADAHVGPDNTGLTGGGQPFSILNPYQGINFIICTQGTYPSRS